MPQNRFNSSLMKSLAVVTLPGMYLVYKYTQFKRRQQENSRRNVAERELHHLNQKIDKLLAKLNEQDTDSCISEDDECVVCLSAKATMQTFPCGHKVVCRRCFIKTIQVAVTQRCLPLTCVVCRRRILKLKQTALDANGPTQEHVLPQQQQAKSQSSAKPTKHSIAKQLFGSNQRPTLSTARQSPAVSTKLMQPLLIYPSESSPVQQRAFGLEPTSRVKHQGRQHASRDSKHQSATAANNKESNQSQPMNAKVSRCSHNSPHIHPSPRPASGPRLYKSTT